MSEKLIAVLKQKIVVEDIEFGIDQVSQERGGQVQIYNRVNASHIPLLSGKSVEQAIDDIGETYTQEEMDSRFALLSGDSYNWFAVRNATEDFHAVSLYQLKEAVNELATTEISEGASHAEYIPLLNQIGKLDISFHVIASQVDMENGQAGSAIVTSGQAFPLSVESIINSRSLVIFDAVDGNDKYVKTNTAGKVDNSLLNFGAVTLVGAWEPQAGTEYPADTTAGNAYIIEKVHPNDGYLYTGGDLDGSTVFNGDFIIYTSGIGWVLSAQNISAASYYNVAGTLPLAAKLNSAGYGISDGGDIFGASLDIESGLAPKLIGYTIDGNNVNTRLINPGSEVSSEVPTVSDIGQFEIYINKADKCIYTIDSGGNAIFIGGYTSKNSDALGGITAAGYAKVNGDPTKVFQALAASNDSDVTILSQVVDLIASNVSTIGDQVYVPLTRTVNGKQLDENITLTYQDVNAMPKDASVNNKKFVDHANSIVLTASDVQAAPSTHPSVMASETVPGHVKMKCENGRLDIWTV